MTSNCEENWKLGRVVDSALIAVKLGLFHHQNMQTFSCDARMTDKTCFNMNKTLFYKIKNENMEEVIVAYLTIYSNLNILCTVEGQIV